MSRGPGRGVLERIGLRLSLPEQRMARATSCLKRRGAAAMLVVRATPVLRT
ncbi:MAG: hypothetical protein ABR592_07580 [Nitriliruptorales bacterium]